MGFQTEELLGIGATTLSGDTSVYGALVVHDYVDFLSTLEVSGSLYVDGSATLTGATTIGGSLDVYAFMNIQNGIDVQGGNVGIGSGYGLTGQDFYLYAGGLELGSIGQSGISSTLSYGTGDRMLMNGNEVAFTSDITTGTSGTSGESGTSGTSGESGTSGTDGTSGTSGENGTSGTSGESGTSGTSGESGTSGTDGTSGTSGESGTSGTSGENGTSGTSGENGTSGTSGESGTSGTSGESGTSGISATGNTYPEFYYDNTGTTLYVPYLNAGSEVDTGSVQWRYTAGDAYNFGSYCVNDNNDFFLGYTAFNDPASVDVSALYFTTGDTVVVAGNLQVNGALVSTVKITEISDAYTGLTTDQYIRATGGTYDIILPEATGSGKKLIIKNIGQGVITLYGLNTDVIDGDASRALSTQYTSVTIIDAATGVWDIV